MLMQKIRDNAAWVVVIAVVCFVALIFVDWGMSPGNNMTRKTVVGSVAGTDLRFEDFDQLVQQKAKEATEQGQDLSSETYASLRRQAFEEMVQEHLFQKVVEEYKLSGTPEQVLDYLRRNPPPGAEKAPIFMGPDSQFSKALYEQWLASPRVYDDRFMQMMETQATHRILPMFGLSRILGAGQPSTDLEAEFAVRRDRVRAWGMLVAAPADSFRSAQAISDADIKKEFDAQKDSFYVGKSSAAIPALIFTKMPSSADSAMAKADADTVAARAQRGDDFAELAKEYSEDPGSAKNGGALGGFQPLSRYVPEFGAAAKLLQDGQVSAAVKSPFGYHVIKCTARQINGTDTLYDLSHVLVKVTVSPETIDLIKNLLDSVRSSVKSGKTFADAAKIAQIPVDTVRVTEGDLGRSMGGVLPGASAWAFQLQKDEKISEVLETSSQLVVLGQGPVQKAGRHLDLVKDKIKATLATRAAAAKATEYLTSVLPKIQACDTAESCYQQIGKLATTKFEGRPAESWVNGIGYAPVELLSIWPKATKAHKTWVGPAAAKQGAMALKLDSVSEPSAQEIAAAVAEQRRSSLRQGEQALQVYMQARRLDGRVVNNLDRFFRD